MNLGHVLQKQGHWSQAAIQFRNGLQVVTAPGELEHFAPFLVFLAIGSISTRDLKEWVEESDSLSSGSEKCIGILIYDKPPDAVIEMRISLLQLDEHFMLIPVPLLEIEQKLSDSAACKGLLDEYVRRYLNPDVFDVKSAVRDPLFFFGRRELLYRLEADLVKGQGIGLFGLRKSGKTSILLQLHSTLKEHPVVHIDLERYSGSRYGAELFNEILRQLSTFVKERFSHITLHLERFPANLPASELTTKFVQQVEMFAEDFEKIGYKLPILCFLDEIERILPHAEDSREKAEEFNACFGALRALIQERQILGLMVTDVHPDCNRINEWPQEGVPTNPVSNFFKEVFLGPFSEEETATMITGLGRWMGERFDDKTLAKIHHESGGHPFIARQLASLIHNRITHTKTTAEGEALIVFSSARRYLEEPFSYSNLLMHYFTNNLWGPLKNRQFDSAMTVLKILAANQNSGRWLSEPILRKQIKGRFTESQLLDAFFWLEATGLILQTRKAKLAYYRIGMSLLTHWLRMNMKDEELQRWQVV
jgi:hypothetical protein